MKPYTDIEQVINYSYYFSCKQNIHYLLCSSAKKGRRERPRQGGGGGQGRGGDRLHII